MSIELGSAVGFEGSHLQGEFTAAAQAPWVRVGDREALWKPSFYLAGIGSYLPPRVVDNDEAGAMAGMVPERIKELFNIEERRWVRMADSPWAAQGQSCGDLATRAAAAALEDAGLRADEVDTLVVVTATPERVSPPLDHFVRKGVGMGEVFGLTMHSACTGIFRAALVVESLMAAQRSRVAVIVAANAISPYLPFGDGVPKDLRMSGVLYGDAAAAIVVLKDAPELAAVEAVTVEATGIEERPGIDFKGWVPPFTSGNGDRPPHQDAGYHDFRRVLANGSQLTRLAADAVLDRLGLGMDDPDLFLTHQATGNLRRIAESVGLPSMKLPVNIRKVGNTIAPSILLLLDDLKRAGRLEAGQLLLLHTAESATWTFGGMAVRWR